MNGRTSHTLDTVESFSARLEELHRAFDQSFADPLRPREVEPEDLLAIEVAGHPYALRIRELLGLFVKRHITPLPAAPAELLGLSAVRGELVAVYDLASLLGYARGEDPSFLVLGRGQSVAFAFATLHGHVRVSKAEIATIERKREPWLTEVVREAGQARPIVELSGITASLEQRLRFEGRKEND
jgi:chemotaxis signal transduction protein